METVLVLEAKVTEYERTNKLLEKQCELAEKEMRDTRDQVTRLEVEKETLRTSNRQLECSANELGTTCAELRRECKNAHTEIGKLKILLSDSQKER